MHFKWWETRMVAIHEERRDQKSRGRRISSAFCLLSPAFFLFSAVWLAGCAGAPGQLFPVPDGGFTVQFFKDPVQVAELSFTDLDGNTLMTSDLSGKVTLVNFWATWCGPCRQEIPDLIKLQERYPDHLQVIGVSVDEGSVDNVRKFGAEHGMNYPIVMATPEITRQFPGITAIPTGFVLDPDARIVQRHVGLMNPNVLEQETRSLAALPANVTVETIENTKEIELADAAHATAIPGLDLSKLTPAQKERALERLNEERCVCSCTLTIAQCRINDAACLFSLPMAEHVVTDVTGS